MSEKPIIMTGESVRAILNGRKSMTRRVIKPQPRQLDVGFWYWQPTTAMRVWVDDHKSPWWRHSLDAGDGPYHAGQRLWVRETWAIFASSYDYEYGWEGVGIVDCGIPKTKPASRTYKVIYAADGYPAEEGEHWKPSIFMPRWASRITLEIVSVRVERVQDISEEDAMAEGVWTASPDMIAAGERGMNLNHIGAYRQLWDSINAARGFGWESNPFVWVLAFRRVAATGQEGE